MISYQSVTYLLEMDVLHLRLRICYMAYAVQEAGAGESVPHPKFFSSHPRSLI